jgi:cytidylate kinase
MIVAIDGPAGSGKSTAARGVAARLGFDFLDTGAMYRAVAFRCLDAKIDFEDARAVAEIAEGSDIQALGARVTCNGVDVTDAIRTPEVSRAASVVAVNPDVRSALVALQRKAAIGRNIVTEGRDQGTIVFPHAEAKFYITADRNERARRRQQELEAMGSTVSLEETLAEIRARDERDKSRDVAPLKQADDAIRVDTTGRSMEEILNLLEQMIRERMASSDSSHPSIEREQV